MCGIFGAIKGSESNNRVFAETVISLGVSSEERGRHSSGLAFYSGEGSPKIIKELKRFSQLKLTAETANFSKATCVLGHTRFATQGSAHDINNASPMNVGKVCGTHNGDIEKRTIPNYAEHSKSAVSQTDTEPLFRELQQYLPGTAGFIRTLEKSIGRMALAFTHIQMPNKLVLVRGALSPIAYTHSQEGVFAYASNPNWFRKITEASKGRIDFKKIVLVPEGTVLVIDTNTGLVEAEYPFVPTCRESDLYLTNSSVYKNFTLLDKKAMNKMAFRKVVKSSNEKAPRPTTVRGYVEIASPRVSYEDGMLFDDFFMSGLTDKPFTAEEEEEGRITLTHVQTLCHAYPSFNESLYGYLLDSEDDEEVEARYAEAIAEAFESGVITAASFQELSLPIPFGASVS